MEFGRNSKIKFPDGLSCGEASEDLSKLARENRRDTWENLSKYLPSGHQNELTRKNVCVKKKKIKRKTSKKYENRKQDDSEGPSRLLQSDS